jgi:hypothetical protein
MTNWRDFAKDGAVAAGAAFYAVLILMVLAKFL